MKNDLLLQMFVDMQTKIFMMSAVLARCNKSIIFQAGNHEMELEVTRYFIDKSFREVNMLLEDMHGQLVLFLCVLRPLKSGLKNTLVLNNIFPLAEKSFYKINTIYICL